jgi:hypothetical protein
MCQEQSVQRMELKWKYYGGMHCKNYLSLQNKYLGGFALEPFGGQL